MDVGLGHAQIIKPLLHQLFFVVFLPYIFVNGRNRNVIPGRVSAASRRLWNRDHHGLHGPDVVGNVRAVPSVGKIRNAPQGMLEICGVIRSGVIKGKIIR